MENGYLIDEDWFGNLWYLNKLERREASYIYKE